MVKPLFIRQADPALFAVYHCPLAPREGKPGVLIVPSMMEENNRSRHVYAQMARSLAESGIGCLILDVSGTGESAGEHQDASWHQWQTDLNDALDWLVRQGHIQISLVAHRTGALLAASGLGKAALCLHSLILWHPVLRGKRFWQNVLRMRAAMRLANGEPGESGDDIEQLIDADKLEIGGYHLPKALVDPLRVASLDKIPLAKTQNILWIDVKTSPQMPDPPASAKQLDQWDTADSDVRYHSVIGPQFWSLLEPEACPALIAATLAHFDQAETS